MSKISQEDSCTKAKTLCEPRLAVDINCHLLGGFSNDNASERKMPHYWRQHYYWRHAHAVWWVKMSTSISYASQSSTHHQSCIDCWIRAKAGHFRIEAEASGEIRSITKQRYLPFTITLERRFIHDESIPTVLDFFPLANNSIFNWIDTCQIIALALNQVVIDGRLRLVTPALFER